MKNFTLLLIILTMAVTGISQCPVYEFSNTIQLPANNNVAPSEKDVCFYNNDDCCMWFCFPRLHVSNYQNIGFSDLGGGSIQVDTISASIGQKIFTSGRVNFLLVQMESALVITADSSKLYITDLEPIGTNNFIYLGEGSELYINHQLFEGDEYKKGDGKIIILRCSGYKALSTSTFKRSVIESTFDLNGNAVNIIEPLTPYLIKGKKTIIIK
jgi:hypothetical protein